MMITDKRCPMGDDGLEARLTHLCTSSYFYLWEIRISRRDRKCFQGAPPELRCPGKEAFCGYLHHSESLFC